ncbi:hypothetical protein RugamoR57_49070 [Duganella caerulea]|uniref:DUF4400 domain-containing protein n=1 Tax=Duganella caerulea TaxID=2885762 RepID=UPI0030E92DBD
MIRYLAILLAASLACLVLWLPAEHSATQFYQAARSDHAACSALWGASYATTALSSALAAAAMKRPASTPSVSAPGPTGPAERRLAGQMQDIASRFYGMPYMRSVEAMTTLACYRLATMLYLAPGLALLLIPALLDAAMRRIIRTHEFRRHDPERYAFGIAGAMLASGALLATCTLPVPMPPQLPATAMLLAIYCLHVAVANFHHSGN